MTSISQLIREAMASDNPTAWFEKLYSAAKNGDISVPWAEMQPSAAMVEWLDTNQVAGNGQRALVIGCGLGDDAEELARRGFQVTAFDISETAINWCRQRFPESPVAYRAVDLFKAPPEWKQHFDFVLESRTIQSLSWGLFEGAVANIADFVAPSGRLLVLCMGRLPHEDRRGIPWPLSRDELVAFEQHGLTTHQIEEFVDAPAQRRFRVEYHRNL